MEPYLCEKISPFLTAKTIQIILIRQVLDFTILRTEDSRELNSVELPNSFSDPSSKLFGLFLASKQKAVESRYYMELLRTFKDYTCYLNTNLCLECPRCVLFGAVNVDSKKGYNLKHRIKYSSAYSILPLDDISETITFNAVSEKDQSTGQALNVTHNIKPLSLFPSIVSLKSITKEELILYIKTLLGVKSYGAETRVKGDVRNEIYGIIGGYEEIITSLELRMELAEIWTSIINSDNIDFNNVINEILEKYKEKAANPNNLTLITGSSLQDLLSEIKNIELNKIFFKKLQDQIDNFIAAINQ